MGIALRRIPLERAVQVAIVATIVAVVLAAGAILEWVGPARKLRWVALLALAVLAVLYASSRWRQQHLRPYHLVAAGLLGLALVSTAWSSEPGLTISRSAALTALFIACAGLALGATGRLESLRRMVHALVVASAVVGVAGLLVLAFAFDRAVQSATAQEPARYQGLGGGPNTAMMVLAIGVPLAAYVLVEARTVPRRAAAVALLALLVGSIVASGSRGALLAAFGGLLTFALLAAPSVPAGAFWASAVIVLLGVSVVLTRLPQPDPAVPARPGTTLPEGPVAAPGYLDANVRWRLQEDVGRPPFGELPSETSRSVLGGSGRAQAWGGALELGAERPVLGYGFGTEDRVFVDRYFEHGSNLPENSYVGLFLQLGVAGVALFVGFVATLVAGALRVLRRPRWPARRLAAACAGGLAAGLLLGVTQSFIYAAGSNATLAVWLCGFLLAAAGATGDVVDP